MKPNLAELESAATAAAEAAANAGGKDESLNTKATEAKNAFETAKAAPSQDPVKTELDRVKKPKTEKEKAAFALKSNARRARELGIDPYEVLSDEANPPADPAPSDENPDEDDDNKPMTRGDFKRLEREKAQKTSLNLADDIEDESERELVKHHIQNTIKPSGNPQEDLRTARLIVNGAKNAAIIEEAQRKGKGKTHSSAPGAPARTSDDENFEPSAEEAAMMKSPFNLTKADIIKARKQAEKA